MNIELVTPTQTLGQGRPEDYLMVRLYGAGLTKKELISLAVSYRCEVDDPGFDFKNGLFRLGS